MFKLLLNNGANPNIQNKHSSTPLIAIGLVSRTNGDGTIGIGGNTLCTGTGCIAIGDTAVASSPMSVALGSNAVTNFTGELGFSPSLALSGAMADFTNATGSIRINIGGVIRFIPIFSAP